MEYCVIAGCNRFGNFESEDAAKQMAEKIHPSWNASVVALREKDADVPDELQRTAPMAMKWLLVKPRWYHRIFQKLTRKKWQVAWVAKTDL